MLNALERNIASANERIVFVAPSTACVSDLFQDVEASQDLHREFVRDVQRLRGSIYLKDGAIQAHQLSPDGLHKTAEDDASWHMLLLDRNQRLTACALYTEHDDTVTMEDLRAGKSPLTQNDEWSPKLRTAIQSELDEARRDRLQFVELGGWAVSEHVRGTAGPLSLALAVYAFSRRCGGVLGMTTATFRHSSAAILKRLGGSRFEIEGATLPPYYDPRYRCMMEMLRFDSRRPNPKYLDLIEQARGALSAIKVVARPAFPLVTDLPDAAYEELPQRAALAS
jgi:hypothetical protein